MKWRTATVGYFETDLTGTIVTKAAICTNMFPMDQGPIEIKKDLTASQEIIVLSIPFTAITAVGEGVTQYMQSVIDNIRRRNAVPTLRPSFVDAISPDVQPGRGYKESIEDVGNTAVAGYRP